MIPTAGCYAPCYAPQCANGCVMVRTWQPQSQGCICPPTSEQTCQNALCPRRGHPPYATSFKMGGT